MNDWMNKDKRVDGVTKGSVRWRRCRSTLPTILYFVLNTFLHIDFRMMNWFSAGSFLHSVSTSPTPLHPIYLASNVADSAIALEERRHWLCFDWKYRRATFTQNVSFDSKYGKCPLHWIKNACLDKRLRDALPYLCGLWKSEVEQKRPSLDVKLDNEQ